MKLTDLEPRWMELDGKRVGFIFRCPHCPFVWLSCKSVAMTKGAQEAIFNEMVPGADIVDSGESTAWKIEGDAFDCLTVTPSINAAPRHWHGFITNGEIR